MKLENKNYKFKSADNDISLSSRDEVKIINIAMTQQASRNIEIISTQLDPGIFDTTGYIEAIKQLSILSKFTKIRILIRNPEPLVQNSHRMIELIHMLTSSIEVRKISEEYKSYSAAFTLFDGKGVIYQPHSDRYEGFANFSRPRLVTELSNFFNEIWEHSTPDENLRRLNI